MDISDIVVVGSGPLGALVARRLADRGETVTILEAGSTLLEPAGSHLRNHAPYSQDRDRFIEKVVSLHRPCSPEAGPEGLPGAGVANLIGGRGLLWTNNCPRIPEFQRWDALSPDEWEHYFGQAEEQFEVLPDPCPNGILQMQLSNALERPLAEQGRQIVPQPTACRIDDDGTVRYLAPGDLLNGHTKSITLHSGVEVTHLECKGSRIYGMSLERNGESFDIYPKLIILACGAIGTPKLLHKSGLRPDALGRWLSYHRVLMSQIVLNTQVEQSGLDPRLWIPPTPDYPWNSMLLRDLNCGNPTESADGLCLAEFQCFQIIPARYENRMILSAESCEFDVPLNRGQDAETERIFNNMDNLVSHIGRHRAGCERDMGPPPGFCHLTGGCRMGMKNDGSSVTDTFGKVWGVDNLYLATVGLVPGNLAVNPTLPAAALALRTADHILSSG